MIVRLICFFMSIVLGLVTVLFGLQVAYAHASKSWPTTQGVVVAFYATPEYKYSVSGRTYSSSYASCNELFNSQGIIQNSSKYALEYPLKARVTVHYCPQKPALAVLETQFNSSGFLLVAALVLATSVCVSGIIFGGQFRWDWNPNQY